MTSKQLLEKLEVFLELIEKCVELDKFKIKEKGWFDNVYQKTKQLIQKIIDVSGKFNQDELILLIRLLNKKSNLISGYYSPENLKMDNLTKQIIMKLIPKIEKTHINEYVDKYKKTPLNYVIFNHQSFYDEDSFRDSIVQNLLKKGADVNIPDDMNRTPLMTSLSLPVGWDGYIGYAQILTDQPSVKESINILTPNGNIFHYLNRLDIRLDREKQDLFAKIKKLVIDNSTPEQLWKMYTHKPRDTDSIEKEFSQSVKTRNKPGNWLPIGILLRKYKPK